MRNAFMSFAAIAVALVAAPAFAQQTTLTAQEQSVVMVEIDFAKIFNSELGKMMDFEGKLKTIPGADPDSFDAGSMSKVTASLSLPDSLEAFQAMGPGSELPMEMFTTMTFKDAGSADAAFAKVKEKSEEVKIGDKTFFKPDDPSSPAGLLAERSGDSMVFMGTEKYISRAEKMFATDGLKSAWGKMSDDAVRIAIDVEGMPALREQIIEMGSQAPPPFNTFAELLNNVNDLRIAIDLDGDNLLTIAATGKDADMAEEFAEGLDALLGMGKMGIMMQAGAIPEGDAKNAVMEIAESLSATSKGSEVTVIVPKPKGFNEAIMGLLGGGDF